MMRFQRHSKALLGLALVCCIRGRAEAKDFVLIIGGGPTAASSQVSIEQNVVFAQLAANERAGGAVLTVLFGSDNGDDDVCAMTSGAVPEANRLLAELIGPKTGIDLEFRRHKIPGVAGPATLTSIQKKLDDLSKRLRPGDRLIIYITGHGGKGTPSSNGHFYAWKHEKLDVATLAKSLGRFDPSVEITVIMAQCYSGAFANLLFIGGDPGMDAAPRRLAGFFSTTAERQAAGCDPAATPVEAAEYSSYFWAALRGKDRGGSDVLDIDLDGDGNISFAEAHAYALVAAPTMDVSLKTSDLYLRWLPPLDEPDSRRLRADHEYYSRLISFAAVPERHVLEQLTQKAKLSGEHRIAPAMKRLEQIEFEMQDRQENLNRLRSDEQALGRKLADAITSRWPYLANPWSPRAQSMLETKGAELVDWLRPREEYKRWEETRQKIQTLATEAKSGEVDAARLARIIETARSVAHAHNLMKFGAEEHKSRFQELVRTEGAGLSAR